MRGKKGKKLLVKRDELTMRCLIIWILLLLLTVELTLSDKRLQTGYHSVSSSWSSINNRFYRASSSDKHGPHFLIEPQLTVDFLNSTGTVILCSASGNPKPVITWLKDDGSPLVDVPSLRQIGIDGSLVFLPFPAIQFRGDVHSTSYKCIASNIIGTIESRPVRVKAIVNQHYEIQVYDDFVIRGNTGVLRCNIPTFMKDYVMVTSWLRSDGAILQSDFIKGGRYTVFPSGELYIQRADPLIDNHQYRCQTKHRISGELKLSSNSGRLIITEPHSNVAPKITDRRIRLTVSSGEPVILPCSGQGSPVPSITWFKRSSDPYQPSLTRSFQVTQLPDHSTNRISELNGALVFRSSQSSDSGKYICQVNNSIGQDQIETELVVTEPLKVTLSPNNIIAQEGQELVRFNCSVSGEPIRKIYWKKDGSLIASSNRFDISENLLTIINLKREDKGMYQCFAANDGDLASDSTGLQMADEPPRFLEVFKEFLVEPSSRVSLKCIATGSPLPQITWTLDGQPISEHLRVRVGDYVTSDGQVNSFVNISSITIEEGGLYSCLASNGIDSIGHQDRLNVVGPPYVKPMGNVTVVSGSTASFHCPYSGWPVTSIVWYKRDSRLPENHRQLVFPNGTLVIRKIERSHDQNVYRCLVTNSRGETGSSQIFITVIVAPLISIDSAPNVREGMRNMLTCNVLDGDPPFTINWIKDGRPIDPSTYPNMNISSVNEYSSTLFISKVTFKDNGNYTCIISNSAASANQTINMLVKVPPKWMLAPSDSNAIVGEDVIMDCQASGYPQPRIWWEHAESVVIGSSPSHYQPVISNSHIHALENGSLIIKEVTKNDEGYYLCQATNGIGSDISKVVKISIHVPAFFESSFTAQTIKKGDSVELSCEAGGERPLTITWSKDRMPFDPAKEPRYKLIETPKDNSILQVLRIKSADRRDSALFSCIATNAYGKDEFNIQVILQEPPDRPDNIRISDIESRNAVISWTTPYSGNSIIISYSIEYKKKPDSWDSKDFSIETVQGSLNSATLRNLEPITSYHVRIYCKNALGSSDYSELIEFTTDEEAPSLPPTDVKVFPLTSRSLQVTWKPVNPAGQNGLIKGYYLGYRVHGSVDPYIFKTITSPDDGNDKRTGSTTGSFSGLEVKITDLRRATKYGVIVQAFNGKGPGPQSEEIICETLINDPPPAPILTPGLSTYNSIELLWNFDENSRESGDLLVNGYYIHYKSSRSDWLEKQISGLVRSVIMDNLECGTSYQFYIIAYNNLGKGDPSQVIAAKTKGSVPVAPSTDIFITINSSSATLNLGSWKTWGCPISHFEIKYKPKVILDWILVSNQIDGSDKYLTLVDLKPGTWYSLIITAHSEAGSTEREYPFATLTDNGATISPLDLSRPLSYPSLSLMVPTSCAVIVLIVIILISFLLIFKRRPAQYDETGVTCGDGSGEATMCQREERLLAENAMLTLLEHGKESSMNSSEFCETPNKIYYPTPYASNHVEYTATPTATSAAATLNKAQLSGNNQSQGQQQSQPHQAHLVSAHLLHHHHHLDSNEVPTTFDRLNLDHTYDIPFPPKWV